MSENIKMVDVTLHIDEETSHEDREEFRDTLLSMSGVMSACYQDKRPHLMLIGYDPDTIVPNEFNNVALRCGFHSELVSML